MPILHTIYQYFCSNQPQDKAALPVLAQDYMINCIEVMTHFGKVLKLERFDIFTRDHRTTQCWIIVMPTSSVSPTFSEAITPRHFEHSKTTRLTMYCRYHPASDSHLNVTWVEITTVTYSSVALKYTADLVSRCHEANPISLLRRPSTKYHT